MPFPVLEYKTNGTGSIYTLMDIVDIIHGPAMIIPAVIDPSAYIEANQIDRGTLNFYYNVLYQFLVRDKWGDMEKQTKLAYADVADHTIRILEN